MQELSRLICLTKKFLVILLLSDLVSKVKYQQHILWLVLYSYKLSLISLDWPYLSGQQSCWDCCNSLMASGNASEVLNQKLFWCFRKMLLWMWICPLPQKESMLCKTWNCKNSLDLFPGWT